MIDKSKDNIFFGTITGILIPVVVLILIILIRKGSHSLFEFFNMSYEMGILPKVISICLIPNLLLFFIFIWSNRMRSARGVLLAMFIAGLIIGLLKIF